MVKGHSKSVFWKWRAHRPRPTDLVPCTLSYRLWPFMAETAVCLKTVVGCRQGRVAVKHFLLQQSLSFVASDCHGGNEPVIKSR